MPKLATGFERLAIDLEYYIKDYQPSIWKEKIKTVALVPIILSDVSQKLFEAYGNNSLPQVLRSIERFKP